MRVISYCTLHRMKNISLNVVLLDFKCYIHDVQQLFFKKQTTKYILKNTPTVLKYILKFYVGSLINFFMFKTNNFTQFIFKLTIKREK